ncbi:MAG TPA: DUF4412 domain-containing protein [Verrucomicrobiae bacterium]|nr:DUF4412 domain-containing protein [Verrucomicrobiae bacterium]
MQLQQERLVKICRVSSVALALFIICPCGLKAFEGRLQATLTQGGQTLPLLYTVGTNFLRIEVTATNRPHPVDIWDLDSGELTLLFPHNRSYVRLKPAAENSTAMPHAGFSPGIGPRPQSPGTSTMQNPPQPPNMPVGLPPGIGSQAPAPTMPVMPMMPMEKVELKATGERTNLLGFACEQYEIKQRGETMEIWATDQLCPFQPYVQNQPHRFGPRVLEETWGEPLHSKKLFPLLATLKFDNGFERYRFEVASVTPQKLAAPDARLFLPPTNYFEIRPLPF